MKKLSMILTVLIIFGTSAIGHTSDKCVVFEGTFERSTRRPVAQFKYFEALDGEATVKVYHKVKGHHARKVKSATIFINGKKVIGHRDFYKKKFFRFWNFRKKKFFRCSYVKQPNDYIEKTVELTKGQNSLEVMLNSRRRGKIKVVIEGQKLLASDDDGDEILMSYDTPCTGGSTALCNDNCPNDFNPDQADSDGDGIGDVCDDTDDGYPNAVIDSVDLGVGSGPWGGIAVSPEGDFVYVSNYNADSVSVIDTSIHDVVDTIKVGTVGDTHGPIALSMTSDGAFVYVNNYIKGTVSVIRTEYNSVIGDPIGVGAYPYAISMAPHGDDEYAYVTNYGSGSVSVIDTSTHSVIENITVGPSPWGVSLTRDGAFAYVAHYGGSVSVIDTATFDVIDTITLGGAISGISVTPDGTHAYVTNYASGSVSVIDTSTHEVVTVNVGNGPDGIAMTPNGAYVYVNNYLGNTVSIIQTSDNKVIDADLSTVEIDPIEVGDEPRRGIAVSSDGKRVYVGNYVSNTVSVIGISDETTQ